MFSSIDGVKCEIKYYRYKNERVVCMQLYMFLIIMLELQLLQWIILDMSFAII